MYIKPTEARPPDLKMLPLRFTETDAHECKLYWKVDFEKMEILLYASIISPVLLLQFLTVLPRADGRFSITEIIEPVQLSTQFNIKLIIESNGNDICYTVRVFALIDHGYEGRFGLELL